MTTTYGGGFNNYTDPTAGFQTESHDSRQAVKSTITPLTIKQLQNISQQPGSDSLYIGDMPVASISIIGVVRNVRDSTEHISYDIEDGTGETEVRIWLNSMAGTPEIFPLNVYVHVSGTIKMFNNKASIANAHVRKIEDHNEVIYQHLYALKTHYKHNSSAGQGLFVSTPAGSELKRPQDQIHDFIKQKSPSMQEGVPFSLICRSLNMSEHEVQSHIQDLLDTGKIYAGLDDHGYLSI